MDQIGLALVELVRSGVPAATKVAYLYFAYQFVTTLIVSGTILLVCRGVYLLVLDDRKKGY